MSSKKCKLSYFFIFTILFLGIISHQNGLYGAASEDKPLTSKIINISWENGQYPWWNGTDVQNLSSIDFSVKVKITNSLDNEIVSFFNAYLEYIGAESNYTISSSKGMSAYSVFKSGANYQLWEVNMIFMEEIITNPLPGTYTFWGTDALETLTDYKQKTYKIYESALLNFIRYDYEYLIIGVLSLCIVSVVSWLAFKKIRTLRLPMILSKKLELIKKNLDDACFNTADEKLDEILSSIDKVNNSNLFQSWNRLKKRSTANLEIRRRLQTYLKNPEYTKDRKANILSLLKEIHSDELNEIIDPLIESEIISALKGINANK